MYEREEMFAYPIDPRLFSSIISIFEISLFVQSLYTCVIGSMKLNNQNEFHM